MKTLAEKFAGKILFRADGCWEWIGARSKGGYGQLRADGVVKYAHRFMYELLVGPIPDGLELDHLCRLRACCNPNHLEPVTRYENIMRGESVPARRARQTLCKRGHALEGENVHVSRRGHRTCKTCRRAFDRSRSPRRKVA